MTAARQDGSNGKTEGNDAAGDQEGEFEMERAATRLWLRRLARSVMVLGGISAGIGLAQYRSGSKTLAGRVNDPRSASPALTQLADSGRKLAELRSVEQRASADLQQVREVLTTSTMTLSPGQAHDARAAMNAAQVAVGLSATARGVALSAIRSVQSAAHLYPASAGSHTMAAALLSARAAAEAAQSTVAATSVAVKAAQAAADPHQASSASGAVAAAFAAAQTAVAAAQTAVDAAQATSSALDATLQPAPDRPAPPSEPQRYQGPASSREVYHPAKLLCRAA
jgi:hypothetical protein